MLTNAIVVLIERGSHINLLMDSFRVCFLDETTAILSKSRCLAPLSTSASSRVFVPNFDTWDAWMNCECYPYAILMHPRRHSLSLPNISVGKSRFLLLLISYHRTISTTYFISTKNRKSFFRINLHKNLGRYTYNLCTYTYVCIPPLTLLVSLILHTVCTHLFSYVGYIHVNGPQLGAGCGASAPMRSTASSIYAGCNATFMHNQNDKIQT
jgi:hypothetical protein